MITITGAVAEAVRSLVVLAEAVSEEDHPEAEVHPAGGGSFGGGMGGGGGAGSRF